VASAYSVADIVSDEQVAARGDIVTVDDPVLGPLRQQAPFPRVVGTPPVVPSGAPRLGEHNREIWCDLVGLSADELAELAADGIV
jgi:crotonobetainyl-CoA:carnitine CoA-transferase CaiB-like acyl-CoA transferase